jgi:RNA polymerase-binding transcription factor DksA
MNMADHADIAGETIEACQKDALLRQAAKLAPQFDSRFNGKDCIDCDDELPAERLAMQRVRCAPCQEIVDKRMKLRGH